MLVFRQVLTCIFQVSRWWKAGTLKSDEATVADLEGFLGFQLKPPLGFYVLN